MTVMATKRRYTDEERAAALAALAANGGNIEKTCRELDIPRMTLSSWAKGQVHPEAHEYSLTKKGPLADHLEEVAWKLAGDLNKCKEGNPQQVAIALGVVVDKMQLLRGKPTAITGATRDQKLDILRTLLGIPPESDDGTGDRPSIAVGGGNPEGNGKG